MVRKSGANDKRNVQGHLPRLSSDRAPQSDSVAPSGLEPEHSFEPRILSPLRLPIPPRGPRCPSDQFRICPHSPLPVQTREGNPGPLQHAFGCARQLWPLGMHCEAGGSGWSG